MTDKELLEYITKRGLSPFEAAKFFADCIMNDDTGDLDFIKWKIQRGPNDE